MTLVARRRAAVLVPWLALAAVTAFAIVQMRARHEAEQGPPVVVEVTAADAPGGATESSDVRAAVHAAETALDTALRDLEAARAEAGRLGREGMQSATRAEAAEARLAVHAARARALEQELGALRSAAVEEPAEAEPADAPAEPATPPTAAGPLVDEGLAWVADAGADDPVRRRRAVEQAAAAAPDRIASLVALQESGADPVALARLAAALPTGEATDALVIGLLLDERADFGLASRVVHALPSAALLRPLVLDALLGRATPGVLKVGLGLVSGYQEALGDSDRRAALAAVLAPRLESSDHSELHAAARAAGLLRLPGLAPRLARLLAHDEGIVRTVAAHALSLVPDLDAVRAAAVKALPKLLNEGALSERTAGLLLAETLVGEPLDYDPAAGEGARREALDAILDRLD